MCCIKKIVWKNVPSKWTARVQRHVFRKLSSRHPDMQILQLTTLRRLKMSVAVDARDRSADAGIQKPFCADTFTFRRTAGVGCG